MLRYIPIGSGQKFIKTYFVFSVCYKEKNRKSKVRPKVLLGLGKSKKENKKIIFAQQCGFDVWQEWITLIKNKIDLVQDCKQMIPKVRLIFFIKTKKIDWNCFITDLSHFCFVEYSSLDFLHSICSYKKRSYKTH